MVPSSLPSFGLRGVREAGSRCLDTRGSWLAEEGRQTLGDEGLMDVTDGREGGVAEEQADRRRRRSLKGGGGGEEWRYFLSFSHTHDSHNRQSADDGFY